MGSTDLNPDMDTSISLLITDKDGKIYEVAVPDSLTLECLNNQLQRTLRLPKTGCWNLEFKGNILENKTAKLSDFITENELKMPLEVSVQKEPMKKDVGHIRQYHSRMLSKKLSLVPTMKTAEEDALPMYLEKEYVCPLAIDYPENEEEKKMLIKTMEQVVKDASEEDMDLDFVREIVLNEHAEEIVQMELDELELKHLPWSSLIFEVIDIKRGSSILNFRLGFKDEPKTREDADMYRILELVVLTIIENIHYIKKIDTHEWNKECLELTAKIQLHHQFSEVAHNEFMKDTISTLRSSLGALVTDTTDDESKEQILKNLLETKKKELGQQGLSLTPYSLKTIRKIILDSKITENDFATISLEDCTDRRNRSSATRTESNYLFPYEYRKLYDIEKDKFEEIVELSIRLPNSDKKFYKTFIHLLDFDDEENREQLIEKADENIPYPKIIREYKKQGGTIGGLRKALEKFKQHCPENTFIEGCCKEVANLQKDLYESIRFQLYCPDQHPAIQDILDFKKMAKKKLKIKTNPMRPFEALRKELIRGDQLWVFHQRLGIRSYAHVMIVLDDKTFMHVTTPTRLFRKDILESEIRRGDLEKLCDEQYCFVVRSQQVDSVKLWKRALYCEGIRFHYDPEFSNCETFADGVHGIWEPSVQGQDLRGGSQKVINALSKWTSSGESLQNKMKKKFQEHDLQIL